MYSILYSSSPGNPSNHHVHLERKWANDIGAHSESNAPWCWAMTILSTARFFRTKPQRFYLCAPNIIPTPGGGSVDVEQTRPSLVGEFPSTTISLTASSPFHIILDCLDWYLQTQFLSVSLSSIHTGGSLSKRWTSSSNRAITTSRQPCHKP